MDFVLSYADLPKLHIAVAVFLGIFVFSISKGKFMERLVSGILISWMFLVFSCTILSRDRFLYRRKLLTPFWVDGLSKTDALNVFLLMPLGFLLPVSGKRNAISVLFLGLFSTCSIEIIHYYTRTGMFDIDDIILNEAGVLIGFLVWKFFDIIFGHSRKKK